MTEAQEAPKFEELLQRFKAKFDRTPAEYHEVQGWLYIYQQVQDQRKRLANRALQMSGEGKRVFWASVLPDGDARDEMSRTILAAVADVEKAEERAAKEIHTRLRKSSWYLEVAVPACNGIGMSKTAGTLTAAKILDAFGSMSRFQTIGQLMRYARLAPENGKAPKRQSGQRIRYNPKAFQALFDLTDQWNRHPDSHWRQRWDFWKVYYREQYPDAKTYPDGRIHNMGRRKVMREFLHDLWDLWRAWEAKQSLRSLENGAT